MKPTLSESCPCIDCGYNVRDQRCSQKTENTDPRQKSDHACQVCNCADECLYYNGMGK